MCMLVGRTEEWQCTCLCAGLRSGSVLVGRTEEWELVCLWAGLRSGNVHACGQD